MTGVIELTGFAEDCSQAVRSLVPLKHYLKNLIIVHRAYVDDEKSMYPGWIEDKAALDPVQVTFVARLDEVYVEGQTVVEINPYCSVRQGALDTILATVKSASPYQTHLGLSTSLVLDGFSLFYGFLIVSYVVDWFWQRVWNRDKMYQALDVRARRVVEVGGKKYIPESSWLWYIRNTGCIPRIYGGESVVTKPTNVKGWELVVWYFYNHRHYCWSWWIMPFSLIWAILTMAAYGLFLGNLTSIYILTVWLWEITAAYLICENYIKLDLSLLLYPFFPVFWVLFPLVIVYSKITTPQRAWVQ